MKLWHVGIVSLVTLFLAACAQQPTEVTLQPEATNDSLAQLDGPPGGVDPYATDPYAADTLTRPQDTGAGGRETRLISGRLPAGARVHVIQKGDTYYSLARKYYNDQAKWKQIYEANRSRYPDKDRIPVGGELVIP
jgi:nucleoid-associated protein YgaU